MRRIFFIVSLIIAFAVNISNGWGATLYVSPAGSDTFPYDTWAKASNSIDGALDAAVAGDIVEISGGVSGITYTEALTPASYGSGWEEEEKITVRGSTESGHNGQVTVDGASNSYTLNCSSYGGATEYHRIKFTGGTSATAYLNSYYGGSIRFYDCIFSNGRGAPYMIRCHRNMQDAIFERCIFEDGGTKRVRYVLYVDIDSGTSGVFAIQWCIFRTMPGEIIGPGRWITVQDCSAGDITFTLYNNIFDGSADTSPLALANETSVLKNNIILNNQTSISSVDNYATVVGNDKTIATNNIYTLPSRKLAEPFLSGDGLQSDNILADPRWAKTRSNNEGYLIWTIDGDYQTGDPEGSGLAYAYRIGKAFEQHGGKICYFVRRYLDVGTTGIHEAIDPLRIDSVLTDLDGTEWEDTTVRQALAYLAKYHEIGTHTMNRLDAGDTNFMKIKYDGADAAVEVYGEYPDIHIKGTHDGWITTDFDVNINQTSYHGFDLTRVGHYEIGLAGYIQSLPGWSCDYVAGPPQYARVYGESRCLENATYSLTDGAWTNLKVDELRHVRAEVVDSAKEIQNHIRTYCASIYPELANYTVRSMTANINATNPTICSYMASYPSLDDPAILIARSGDQGSCMMASLDIYRICTPTGDMVGGSSDEIRQKVNSVLIDSITNGKAYMYTSHAIGLDGVTVENIPLIAELIGKHSIAPSELARRIRGDAAPYDGGNGWDRKAESGNDQRVYENPLFMVTPDYHLLAGSPCIDAGDSTVWDGDPDTADFEGSPIFDIIDIGAYEFVMFCEADFDLDGDVDNSDLASFALWYEESDAKADLDYDGYIGISDITVFSNEYAKIDCI